LASLPARRISLLYAALFFDLGMYLPFFPIWLNACSLTKTEIGLVLAAPLIARIVANPVVATIADRRGSINYALSFCAVAVVLFTALLGSADAFLPILFLTALIGLAQGPMIALTDTFTWSKIQASHDRLDQEHCYGRIRLWGSVGFILANLVVGQLLVHLPASSLIWLIVAAATVAAGATLSLTGAVRSGNVPGGVSGVGITPSYRLMAAIIVGASAVQASHAMYYAFSSLHWAEKGMSSLMIGVLWAASVVSEVAFFGFASRISGLLRGPLAMLVLGASASAIRWSAMAFDPPIGALILVQIGHGLTFGATQLGSMVAISHFTPFGMRARAQGWLAAGWAGVMATLTTLCGAVYPDFGQRTYWMMVVVALFGLSLFVIAAKFRPSRGFG
jgi:MFS transporter, PPP family, 3-phenylpropionic acid transporter